MAERNVKYISNPRSLRIPGVEDANNRAISAGMAQLNQSINRLTAFASQKNKQITAVKGAEYGAANAPTIEQINDAVKAGEELEFPGSKTGTLFDRAVNKAAMEVFSDNIETLARNQITQKSVNALENNVPLVSFREDLDAIIQGYANSFDEQDAGFAQRFKARMGIVANSEYKSYAGEYRTKIQKAQRAAFTAGFQVTINNTLKKVITNGISSVTRGDAPGAPVIEENIAVTTEILAGMKAEIAQSMVKRGFGPSEVRTHLDLFDKKAQEYAYDIIEAHILSADDEVMAIKMVGEIMRGEMPENVQTAFEVLGPEKIQDARKLANETLEMYRQEQQNYIKIKEETRKALVRDFDDAIARAAILQVTNFEAGNLMLLEVLKDYEKLLTPEVAAFRKKMPRVGARIIPESSDVELANTILQDLFSNRPRFTVQTIMDRYNQGQLSQADYVDFLGKYRLRADENFSRALKLGRSSFELNENFIIINPGQDNAKRVNKFYQFEREMMEARELDPTTFDAVKWAQENLPRFLDENTKEEIESARNLVNRNSDWTDIELNSAMNGTVIKNGGETLTKDLASRILKAKTLLKDNE